MTTNTALIVSNNNSELILWNQEPVLVGLTCLATSRNSPIAILFAVEYFGGSWNVSQVAVSCSNS